MQITVFGATGRTGALVLELALERGHDVTAFLRGDGSSPSLDPRVQAVTGSFSDRKAIVETLRGRDAVISALGHIVGETRTEVSEATEAVVRVMETLVRGDVGPRRLVLAANSTVFTDDELTGDFANVTAEHRRDLTIVRASALDWTVLAPTVLRDDRPAGSVAAKVGAKAPGPSIARADFALAMVDALERPDWIDRAVGISS